VLLPRFSSKVGKFVHWRQQRFDRCEGRYRVLAWALWSKIDNCPRTLKLGGGPLFLRILYQSALQRFRSQQGLHRTPPSSHKAIATRVKGPRHNTIMSAVTGPREDTCKGVFGRRSQFCPQVSKLRLVHPSEGIERRQSWSSS